MGVRASGQPGAARLVGLTGLGGLVALNSTVRLRAQHNWANCQKPAKYSTQKIREIDGT